MKRFLPLLIILLAMALIYVFGIQHYFSFEAVKKYHQTLKGFVAIHPLATAFLYILIYITATTLSIPGAIFFTLLGGYLFPQPLSTLYAVFSATCGAMLIFLAARTALKEVLKKKAAPFFKKMEKGFQKNAASYLLFLRFVPLFPFWLVNIVPAFFNVPLKTYVWTTLVGITPASIVFTLAGGGLEKVFENEAPFSISALFNTEIKIALALFVILVLIPPILKRFKKAND